jgi:hypothetical protein
VSPSYPKTALFLTRCVQRSSFGRFISQNPFSTLAITSLFGDGCYLGYALHASQGLSVTRLIGAIAALMGNVLILAYGDAQAGKIALEKGWCSRLFLYLRRYAKRGMQHVTTHTRIRHPLFRGFGLLALNGVALTLDAWLSGFTLGFFQVTLGLLIFLGCGCFAFADLVNRQSQADFLTKLGPSLLACANIPALALGFSTGNIFMIVAPLLFMTGNLAGFFTHIEKRQAA